MSRNMLAAFLVLTVGIFSSVDAQWVASLNSLLQEVKACQPPVTDDNPCSAIAAKAVKAVYGVDEFDTPGEGTGFVAASRIVDQVPASSEWTHLGRADSQEALTAAQEAANAGKATLAILMEKPQGHVVIILPGELTPSGKWGLSTPNSASYFLNTPGRSFVGKPMSYAFTDPAKVELYSRNN